MGGMTIADTPLVGRIQGTGTHDAMQLVLLRCGKAACHLVKRYLDSGVLPVVVIHLGLSLVAAGVGNKLCVLSLH